MSTEACDAQGGIWCPAPVDCTVLKTCIINEVDWARTNERPAYEQYLIGAPFIEDPTDEIQCGKGRNYYGFDEYFINDHQICEDIKQLRDTRDFAFMDEFYAQGSDTSSSSSGLPGEVDVPTVPPLVLSEPDRSKLLCCLFSVCSSSTHFSG
jgi:hypothetical protein